MAEADAAPEPKVKDVMVREVVVARETDTLAFASQVLLWRAIRHLPILDVHDHVVGILSDRDVLPHVLEGPPGSRPVAEFMTREVRTIGPDRLALPSRVPAASVMSASRWQRRSSRSSISSLCRF